MKLLKVGSLVIVGVLSACGGGGSSASAPIESELEEKVKDASSDFNFEVSEEVLSEQPSSKEADQNDLFRGFTDELEKSTTSDDEKSDILDFGEEKTTTSNDKEKSDTTESVSQVTSDVGTTTVPKRKIPFAPPQNCSKTPTTGTAEKFVEALYRNCLYRPIVADSNQPWVKKLNDNELESREWLRDNGVYLSAESQCLRGVGYPDRCSDAEVFDQLEDVVGKNYEIVCEGEYSAPNERIKQRLSKVCAK